jgi:hypothetical protein
MKESFELKSIEKPTQEHILNEWDKEMLFKGGMAVVRKILEKFDDKLPDAIIYPETSARPLYYLFNPVFEKIYKKNNLKKPEVFFFNVTTPYLPNQFSEGEGPKSWNVELNKDEIIGHLEDKIKNIEDSREDDHEEQADSLQLRESREKLREQETWLLHREIAGVEKTFNKRIPESYRAKEIKDTMIKKGIINPRFVVIDDAVMTGSTTGEISRAFKEEIPYFALFGEEGVSEPQYCGILLNYDNDKNPDVDLLRFGFASMPKNKIGVGVSKKNNLGKYSQALNKTEGFTSEDQKNILLLRKEMSEAGEQLASQF